MASTEIVIVFSATEARLLEESAKRHGMSVSDVVRSAVVLWREYVGDRHGALEQWTARLVAEHGHGARLTARVNDELSLDIEIEGRCIDGLVGQAVLDRHGHLHLWVCEPDTAARVYLGRVRALSGAALVVPIAALPVLGVTDGEPV